jgi:predicted Zn-dependent protease
MKSWVALVLSVGVSAGVGFAGENKKDDPSQIGNRDVGRGVNFYSIEKEIALGKQLSQEVARQTKLLDDPIIAEYVNRVGQNLVRNSDAHFAFQFQVIDDDSPNAFALPGGFVFVNTGLIKIADEEDEFAAAVAHEIAHVAARHMTRQATKAQLASMLNMPAAVLLGGGWGGYAARQGVDLALPTMFMKFSRGDESEADYLGVQYMYAAGYDPMGAVSIFEKLESLRRTNPGFVGRMLSSHPLDADRINRTQSEIERILPARSEYVVTTSEYRDMRMRLIDMQAERKSSPGNGGPKLKTAPRTTPSTRDEDPPAIRRRRDLM